MNLLDSLLDAIVRLEGEALVMHVGEKPYVVTTSSSMNAYRGPLAWGQVELSTRLLTPDAVLGMLGQILPLDQRQVLEEFGAVEYEVPREGERFIIIAARGGDDVWLEVRRRHEQAEEAAVEEPQPLEEPQPFAEPEQLQQPEQIAGPEGIPQLQEQESELPEQVEPQRIEQPEKVPAFAPPEQVPPAVPETEDAQPATYVAQESAAEEHEEAYELRADEVLEPAAIGISEEAMEEPRAEVAETAPEQEVFEISVEDIAQASEVEEPVAPAWSGDEAIEVVPDAAQTVPTTEDVDALLAESAAVLQQAQPEPPAAEEPVEPVQKAPDAEEPRSAVILPMSRTVVRQDVPPAATPDARIAPIEHILRVAAARGASTVYVVAGSKPMIRVDGEISALDAETTFAPSDVERVIMELSPARGRDGNQPVEWMSDVPEAGRVRCVTFADHRGPGIIFRMIPPRAISAEQLGLSAEVQALCAQPDGLVVVTGLRASGKSTLLNAFVDLVNQTRSDHVITVESQIGFVHESRRSFVSQREVRGDSDAALAAVRSAFREDPDVLVIEDLRTPEIVVAALEAAESGRLVFGSLPASSTVTAVERLVELLPAERRSQAQGSLASTLRGVVGQVLLRKVKGGRIAAREVLLNTPSVAGLISEGKLFQLPVALESGRRQGMVPLNESLAALVRDGTVHVAEAYRKAADRDGLLALFKRDGVDTSFAERLA